MLIFLQFNKQSWIGQSLHTWLLSHKIFAIVKSANSFQVLSTSLYENFYWNYLDLRMMEAMAAAFGMPVVQESIVNFKRAFFSKTLKEVAPQFSIHRFDTSSYVIMKEVLEQDLTLSELHDQHFFIKQMLLEIDEDTFTICKIVIGSLKVDWLLPIDYVQSLRNAK